MENPIANLSALLKAQIEQYKPLVENSQTGQVITVGDGIAFVSGLGQAMLGELLNFDNKIYGMVLSLEQDSIGVVLMGNARLVSEGDKVKRTKQVISVPVGDMLLGRVINALGQPIDNKKPFKITKYSEIFKVASGVMTRQEVNAPIETGILSVDAMIPIGKGQRELIIGDRQTGKTALAIDTIINQRGKKVKCVYVAIGQKNSTVAQIVQKLERYKALDYTTVVVASASELAPMQYIAPYTGVTIAEFWMNQGQDVLIVYDDLSKHAVAYRTLSLLLRRPPGREAYPGDVFYLHSQLLERAAKLNQEYGGGSITALPIIETQAGNISAYIPTNVISITDGQIFMLTSLFNLGQRPAVDIGYSVSRVGSSAQIKAIKQVSGSLKLELAQYNEMADFAQFGSDLDEVTQRILRHGKKVLELMKQPQYWPLDQIDQVLILLAIKERLINPVPLTDIQTFKNELINFFNQQGQAHQLKMQLSQAKAFDKALYDNVKHQIYEFVKMFIKSLPNYNSKENDALPEITPSDKSLKQPEVVSNQTRVASKKTTDKTDKIKEPSPKNQNVKRASKTRPNVSKKVQPKSDTKTLSKIKIKSSQKKDQKKDQQKKVNSKKVNSKKTSAKKGSKR